MKKIFIISIILISCLIDIQAQVESASLTFNRGKLWQSVYNGKIAPSFNNWKRVGVGLDWPGFDPSWVNQNLGGAPSYMLSGGFLVGCKKTNDSVLVVEDWALAAGTISTEATAKYLMTKHTKPFGDTGNYWLLTDPKQGEEVIESVWEFNTSYNDVNGIWQQLPIRVKRTVHQWSGNKREENYVLYEYTFTNISKEVKDHFVSIGDTARLKTIPDTLKDFYATLTYAIHANSRSWNVLFPSEPSGAKNTWYFWDNANKMIWGRAADYLNTTQIEKDFGFSNSQGLLLSGGLGGEFLAPGFVGIKVLYASPNKSNQTTKINGYGWSAADNSFDFGGPLANKNTEVAQYDVLVNPANANSPVKTSADSLMRRARMWSMISLGPWDLNPGDSIKIAVAEIVDGVDYKYAVDSTAGPLIGSKGYQNFISTAKKAQFTYDHKFNHPDPPAAPKFTVDFYKDRERFVANEIKWTDQYDGYINPDDGTNDLVGYKVYRSSHLPIGPWDSVGVVYKQDPKIYNSTTHQYTFIDSTVSIGSGYYYSLTAFNSEKTSWSVDPTAVFEETGTTHKVPSLETSIYANKNITKFTATLPAAKTLNEVLVVPNPYIIGKGRSQIDETDRIQFVNLPNPCTIRIYTVTGELVKTIHVSEGDGAIASWDQITDFGQYVESGIYIFHVESPAGTKIGKFSIIR